MPAACLTLGLIELSIGLAQPPRAARLLFALSAVTVACVSGLELALMQTAVLAEWWTLMRLLDIAVGVMLVTLMAFIWTYFGTGRKWLALAVPFCYSIGLAFDYLPGGSTGSGMTYQTLTGFRTVETFGGASFHMAEGVPNPWNVFPYLAVLAQIAFVVDASVRFRRNGGGRRAMVVGSAIVFFFLCAGLQASLVETGVLNMRYMVSWAYLAVLIAMTVELNAEVLAGARLASQLQESERRMDLASAAAHLGMWTWDIVNDTIWATRRARTRLGFSESEHINRAQFRSVLHPEDRDAVDQAIESALVVDRGLDMECRVAPPQGARALACGARAGRSRPARQTDSPARIRAGSCGLRGFPRAPGFGRSHSLQAILLSGLAVGWRPKSTSSLNCTIMNQRLTHGPIEQLIGSIGKRWEHQRYPRVLTWLTARDYACHLAHFDDRLGRLAA